MAHFAGGLYEALLRLPVLWPLAIKQYHELHLLWIICMLNLNLLRYYILELSFKMASGGASCRSTARAPEFRLGHVKNYAFFPYY